MTTWLHPRRTARLEVHDAQLFVRDAPLPPMHGDFIAAIEECRSIELPGFDARLRVTTGRNAAGAPRTRAAAAIADHVYLYVVAYETSSTSLLPLLDLVETIRSVRRTVEVPRHLWSVE